MDENATILLIFNHCFNISATFEKFLGKDFDAKGYANGVIQNRGIGECLGKLADGVRLLDKELHAQVITFIDFIKIENICQGLVFLR